MKTAAVLTFLLWAVMTLAGPLHQLHERSDDPLQPVDSSDSGDGASSTKGQRSAIFNKCMANCRRMVGSSRQSPKYHLEKFVADGYVFPPVQVTAGLHVVVVGSTLQTKYLHHGHVSQPRWYTSLCPAAKPTQYIRTGEPLSKPGVGYDRESVAEILQAHFGGPDSRQRVPTATGSIGEARLDSDVIGTGWLTPVDATILAGVRESLVADVPLPLKNQVASPHHYLIFLMIRSRVTTRPQNICHWSSCICRGPAN